MYTEFGSTTLLGESRSVSLRLGTSGTPTMLQMCNDALAGHIVFVGANTDAPAMGYKTTDKTGAATRFVRVTLHFKDQSLMDFCTLETKGNFTSAYFDTYSGTFYNKRRVFPTSNLAKTPWQ